MADSTPIKRVVGLRYAPEEGLPQLVVKGSGALADRILERRDALDGPPLVQDAALLDQLYKLPMDARIGPELFELVAALLAHVFHLEQLKEKETP